MKDFFRNNWQHFAIVALFFAMVYVYFLPEFNGQGLKQHDVQEYIGAAHESYHFKDKTGEEQLWSNSMFGGMPTTQTTLIHPGNFLGRAIMNFINWMPSPAGMVLLHLLGFYIMLLCFRVNKWIALIGAIGFAFASYEIIILQAGHNSKSLAVAFIPPVIGAFYMAYRYKLWLGIGLSALLMTLQLSCNHLQVSYYMLIMLLILGIGEFVRTILSKEYKHFLVVSAGLALAYVLGAAVNYGNISMTNAYAKSTIRGGNDLKYAPDGTENKVSTDGGLDKDYITNWSYGKGESFTLLSPYVKGGGTVVFAESPHADVLDQVDMTSEQRQYVEGYPVYWGEQPMTSGPVYVGVVLCFLAFLGMFFIKDPSKWALLAITALALMLSWGKNFMGLTDFFLENVPAYNKFRTVTIILVLIELTIPLLAVLFLQKLYEQRDELKAKLKKVLYVGGGFVLFLFVVKFAGLGDNFSSQEFDMKQLDRIEQQISQSIDGADPAAIQQQFGVNVNDPAQRQQFLTAQMKTYEDNLEKVREARALVFHQSMNRSIGFTIVAFGLLVFCLYSSVSVVVAIAGMGLLIIIDLFGVSVNYLSQDEKYWMDALEKAYPYTPEAYDEQILQAEVAQNPALSSKIRAGETRGAQVAADLGAEGEVKRRIIESHKFMALNENTNFRVFDLTTQFASARASYFHKSLGGYHGAKLRTIQNLYEFHLSRINNEVYNMLNVKYFIQPGEGGNLSVRPNPEACGNAWFVKNLRVVKDRDTEINSLGKVFTVKNGGNGELVVNGEKVTEKDVYGFEYMKYVLNGDSIDVQLSNGVRMGMIAHMVMDVNGQVNTVPDFVMQNDTAAKSFNKLVSYEVRSEFLPKETAVASEENLKGLSKRTFNGEGTIRMTNYSPMELKYNASSRSGGLAVFSEIYSGDSWKATVDGKEVPVYNVNYLLRAIVVPAGDHKVVFTYDRTQYQKSNNVSAALAGLVIFLTGLSVYLQIRADRKKDQ